MLAVLFFRKVGDNYAPDDELCPKICYTHSIKAYCQNFMKYTQNTENSLLLVVYRKRRSGINHLHFFLLSKENMLSFPRGS